MKVATQALEEEEEGEGEGEGEGRGRRRGGGRGREREREREWKSREWFGGGEAKTRQEKRGDRESVVCTDRTTAMPS